MSGAKRMDRHYCDQPTATEGDQRWTCPECRRFWSTLAVDDLPANHPVLRRRDVMPDFIWRSTTRSEDGAADER